MRIRIPVSLLAILAIGLAVSVGAYLAYAHGSHLEARTASSVPVSAPVAAQSPARDVAQVIAMTPQQYLPVTVRVGRGESVRFENAGAADQWPQAESGPSAQGIVVSGNGWNATFTERGTFTYRDRVYPHVGATVVVD